MIPAAFPLHREIEALRATTSEHMARQYDAGVREGWRQARAWLGFATFAVLTLGIVLGVVLTVSFIGAYA